MNNQLTVMEIERFAVHDGPGIRTVIFLKGCPLHCPWCANPESKSIRKALFHDETKCIRCNTCLHVCSHDNLIFKGSHLHNKEQDCQICEQCKWSCPKQAINFIGEWMQVSEIMDIIRKDQLYYHNSDGGVTLSGGEPFYQFTQVIALLKAIRKEELHVCVETTLQIDKNKLLEVLPFVDLFYVDYKHHDEKILKDVTGADVLTIEENIKTLLEHHKNVIIRIPVIPDFNHDIETILLALERLKKLGIEEVHFLPFHNYGKVKYQKMGIHYTYADVEALSSSKLHVYVELAKSYGFKTRTY